MFGKKITKKADKAEKEAKKIAEMADGLESANARRVSAGKSKDANKPRLENAQQYDRYLDKEELRKNVQEVRYNLYRQRDKLCRRLLNTNLELEYTRQNYGNVGTAKYAKQIEEFEKDSKRSYYALTVVVEIIEKLNDIKSEYEWQEILHDLTLEYKPIHELTDDTDLLSKIVFLVKNAQLTRKGEISLKDIENFYHSEINELIDNADTTTHITNGVFELKSESDIYDAIQWGKFIRVQESGIEPAMESKVNTNNNAPYTPPPREPAMTNPAQTDISLDSNDGVNNTFENMPEPVQAPMPVPAHEDDYNNIPYTRPISL